MGFEHSRPSHSKTQEQSKTSDVSGYAAAVSGQVDGRPCRKRVVFVWRADSGGAVAAREEHGAGACPGQRRREPTRALGLLEQSQRFRGHRPADGHAQPGRAGGVAVVPGTLLGLALGDLLAEEPDALNGRLGRAGQRGAVRTACPESAVSTPPKESRRRRSHLLPVSVRCGAASPLSGTWNWPCGGGRMFGGCSASMRTLVRSRAGARGGSFLAYDRTGWRWVRRLAARGGSQRAS